MGQICNALTGLRSMLIYFFDANRFFDVYVFFFDAFSSFLILHSFNHHHENSFRLWRPKQLWSIQRKGTYEERTDFLWELFGRGPQRFGHKRFVPVPCKQNVWFPERPLQHTVKGVSGFYFWVFSCWSLKHQNKNHHHNSLNHH